MDAFQWISPTEFIFGEDSEQKIGAWAQLHQLKCALIVSGGSHAEKSGLLARVRESLTKAQVNYAEYAGVRPNPEIKQVHNAVSIAKQENCDFVCAVGGGSVMDAAKAICLGALYEGDVWDFYHKPNPKKPGAALPLAVIPTIAASGSEASESSVISNDAIGMKTSVHGDFLRPRVAFMNPALTLSVNRWQTSAGIVDMSCHIYERFFSASPAVQLSDSISLGLARSIISAARRVNVDPSDLSARSELMWAGTLAHNGLCGCGRAKEDWATHALEHELSALKPEVTHGAGLAVIWPRWARYVMDKNPTRFCQFGEEALGLSRDKDEDDLNFAERSISTLQEFFVELGMPQYLEDFGFTPDDVDELVASLQRVKGDAIGSFKRLSLDDARKIYLSAFRHAGVGETE